MVLRSEIMIDNEGLQPNFNPCKCYLEIQISRTRNKAGERP